MSQIIDLTTGYNELVDQMNQMDDSICKALTERVLRYLRTVKDDPRLTGDTSRQGIDLRGAIDLLDDVRPPWVRDWRIINDGTTVLATIRYGYREEFQMALDPRILRDDADAAFAEIAAEVAPRIVAAQAKQAERAKYHEQRRQANEKKHMAALLAKYDLVAVPAPKDEA